MRRPLATTFLTVALALAAAVACRDSVSPQPKDSVRKKAADSITVKPQWAGNDTIDVSTSTSGSDLDPDGYTVTVDGETSQSIATNGSVMFTDRDEGDHTVELSDVASNCTVEGDNPRTVTIPPEGRVSTTFFVSCTGAGGGGVTRVTGLGQIGTGSPTPGNNVVTFDFDVAADLTGHFTFSDYSIVRPDGSVATLRVDPSDPETAITAFRTGSSACSDPSRGAEFDGTARVDDGTLAAFTVVTCDNGPAGSGLDFFGVAIPAAGYNKSGPVTDGDIVLSTGTGGGGGGTGVARVAGMGQIGTGSPTPGNDVVTFDFDVAADLTGRFTASDYTDVRPDGVSVGTIRVDPSDPETAITAFRTTSSACSDPSRGTEFDATGREDTGGLVAITVVTCDNGPSGSGMDIFGVIIPSEGYNKSGPVTSGDVVKSGS
jgi:hypothetical protein